MSAAISPALLDTDILSAIMRRQPPVLDSARPYLKAHRRFTFSIITRYEILRGLLAKKATRQLTAFNSLCNVSEVLPLTDAIIERAAGIYADLHREGSLIGDADILIAATALENDLRVVTNNERHFERIDGIQIDNWLD